MATFSRALLVFAVDLERFDLLLDDALNHKVRSSLRQTMP
jgi:hypothetical protein